MTIILVLVTCAMVVFSRLLLFKVFSSSVISVVTAGKLMSVISNKKDKGD